MLEAFHSFFDTLKERFKNPFTEKNKTPFAGAFIISLIVINWELLCSLFYFDHFESRVTKIRIIQEYLDRRPWYVHIFMPVLYAFCSIIFFYLLNNVSLAITNLARWLKVLVLQLTDQNKLIERSDFEKLEKSLITEKNRRKELKEENAQLEEDIGVSRSQLKNLTAEFAKEQERTVGLQTKNEELESIIEEHGLNATNKVRIIYATYGTQETFKIVTQVLRTFLSDKTNSLTVDNKVFEGDPVPNFIKRLFVVYTIGSETKTLDAIEGSIVELDEYGITVKDTNISNKKARTLNNEALMIDFFSGDWTLTFSKDGASGSERVVIDKDGKYFANGIHSFFLKAIDINRNQSSIKFDKIKLDGSQHSTENLKLVDGKRISGINSLGYKLEYIKNDA